ncbi:conserved hypothetical protein [Ricinus communis]|uniref:Uncharacterized protein n=1 Tax=Ricinus communis TaxID=3988 RepID=B9RBY9_RICCO|nr:conserved hypothetical protein [Ricinus communis]
MAFHRKKAWQESISPYTSSPSTQIFIKRPYVIDCLNILSPSESPNAVPIPSYSCQAMHSHCVPSYA